MPLERTRAFTLACVAILLVVALAIAFFVLGVWVRSPHAAASHQGTLESRRGRGNADFAAEATGSKDQIDRTAELFRNEITNNADAVFAIGGNC
jgi:hypothetical protein